MGISKQKTWNQKRKIYAEPIQCIWIWSQEFYKEVQKNMLNKKNNATLAIDTIQV